MHTHTLKSGIIVLHIHPYPISSDASDNNNHHGEKELLTLDMNFFQSYSNPPLVVLEKPNLALLATICNEPLQWHPQRERQSKLSLRGPPSYPLV